MKTRLTGWILLCSVVALFVLPNQGHATTLTASKTITWVFPGDPEAQIGHLTRQLSVLARDNHINDPKQSGPFSGDWLIGLGLSGFDDSISAGGGGHPEASSTIDFRATRPRDLGNGNFELIGEISTVLKNKLVPVQPGNHSNQIALAAASGTMSIPTGFIQGFVLATNDQLVVVDPSIESSGISLGASLLDERRGVIEDPISITLLEVETGRRIIENLFSFESTMTLFGSVLFDAVTGIVLDAPADGVSSARISGGPISSWITGGPGPFSASLTNGVFTKTGAFDPLPWLLTFDGPNIIRATLPSQFVPQERLTYRIPSFLITDDNTYQQTLNLDISASLVEAVPAPSSLTLFGLGGLLVTSAIVYRRSCRKRDRCLSGRTQGRAGSNSQ